MAAPPSPTTTPGCAASSTRLWAWRPSRPPPRARRARAVAAAGVAADRRRAARPRPSPTSFSHASARQRWLWMQPANSGGHTKLVIFCCLVMAHPFPSLPAPLSPPPAPPCKLQVPCRSATAAILQGRHGGQRHGHHPGRAAPPPAALNAPAPSRGGNGDGNGAPLVVGRGHVGQRGRRVAWQLPRRTAPAQQVKVHAYMGAGGVISLQAIWLSAEHPTPQPTPLHTPPPIRPPSTHWAPLVNAAACPTPRVAPRWAAASQATRASSGQSWSGRSRWLASLCRHHRSRNTQRGLWLCSPSCPALFPWQSPSPCSLPACAGQMGAPLQTGQPPPVQ